MIIDQHTALYGVVGYPLGHSLSPAMHNGVFLKTGLNAVYLAFETKDIDGCLQGIKALGIRGMSVTIPHKSVIIPLLDEVDDLAKRIGAVNTIVNSENRLVGYNTDALGVLKALEDKIELSGRNCLIIGAGGAARAVGFIMKENNVDLCITNRSYDKGEALARSLGCPFVPLKDMGDIHADLLIQTTPVGMYPHDDQCIVPRELLKKGMVVMDIVYNPIETKLLSLARIQGCITISGLWMFVHQGAEQFRLWTGLEAPVTSMIKLIEMELGKSR